VFECYASEALCYPLLMVIKDAAVRQMWV